MVSVRHLLRHFLAALDYRTRKALRAAPEGFGSFRAAADLRSPSEVIHHMSSLLHATTHRIRGEAALPLPPLDDPSGEAERFYTLLGDLSQQLNTAEDLRLETAERLLQGPLSDAMTHAGQLAMLRRFAGSPVPPENFYAAAIQADPIPQESSPADGQRSA